MSTTVASLMDLSIKSRPFEDSFVQQRHRSMHIRRMRHTPLCKYLTLWYVVIKSYVAE